jgi:hypothetical protein
VTTVIRRGSHGCVPDRLCPACQPTNRTSPPNETPWVPWRLPERTYVDQGPTGTNRERPGLREALAACRPGDSLLVAKLDRLARSLPDTRTMIEDLTRRHVN